MKTWNLLLATAVVGLAPSVAAQTQFDLILPDAFDIQGYDPGPGGYKTEIGILVNTGSVPIYADEWSSLVLHFGHSSEDLDWFYMLPETSGWDVLMPGEAMGSADPAYTALLQPGETLAYPFQGVIDVRLDGAVGQSPLVTYALEFVDQRVRAECRPTIVDQAGPVITVMSAVRWSSETVVPSFAESTPGCPLPLWPMPILPTATHFPDGGTTSKGSDLPVLGNDRFIIDYPLLPPSEVGNLWVLMVALPAPPITILGCEVIDWAQRYDVGIVPAVYPSETTANPGFLSIPIPDDPALAGFEVDLQWGVFSPNAANGVFATSPGHRLHLHDLGL